MNAPTTDLTTALPPGLTQAEMEFVWNLEGLGLPPRKAASLAGVPYGALAYPHIVQARETLKRALRASMGITKDDVVFGIRDAIGRAQLLGEPGTEILGWEKIAKLLGYESPKQIDVNITASVEVLKTHVRRMDDNELARLVGSHDIIDADFYRE